MKKSHLDDDRLKKSGSQNSNLGPHDEVEERYKVLFNHLSDEVHLWELIRDDAGNIENWTLVDANPAALKTWKKSKKDILGKTTDEIFGDGASEKFLPIVKKIFGTGKSHHWVEYFQATHQYLSMTSIPMGEFFMSTGKDITEEKEKQKALQETSDLLLKAEEMASQGSFRWDIKNDKWQFSENWFKIHGLRNFDISSDELLQLAHPDDSTMINDAFAKALSNEKPYDLEHRIIRKDTGEVRWVKATGKVSFSSDGQPLDLVGLGRDITEEKLTRENLKKSEDFLQKTGEIAKVGGWYLDEKFDTVHWTKSTYDIHEVPYDYKPTTEEAINFYHPDDREMVKAAVNKAIGKGETYEFEARIITGKGNLKWIYSKGEPEMLNGKCVKLTGVFQDITDSKQSELLLKESEHKFKSIFQNSTVAKVIADEQGRYIDVNETACALLGYSHYELTNMSVSDVVSASRDSVTSSYDRFKQKGVESGEVELKTKNGEVKIAEYYSNKIEDNLYLSTLIDITEKRTKEEELNHIANNLPGAFLRYKVKPDSKDELLYISEGAFDLYGVTPEQALENVQLVWNNIYKDDVNRMASSIQESAEKLTPWEAEYRLLLPDGKTKWVWERGMPQKQKDESVIFHTIALDITEKKKAKEDLKESRKQYENISDNLPGMVLKYKLNKDGSDELLYVSDGVKDLYEVTASEAIANNQLLWSKVHKDDLEAYSQSIEKAAEELSHWRFEHRLLFPDGRVKWVDMRGVPSQNNDGSITWDSIGLDITKRKEAELELANINEHLEELVEERARKAIELSKELELYWFATQYAQVGVWRYDLKTNTLEWDDIMYKLYGIDKEDFSGAYEAWESNLHPDDKKSAVNALEQSITNQVDFNTTFRLVHSETGKITHIRGKGKVEVNDKGETISVFGTNWDITREMQLAEEREKIINDLEIYQMASRNAEVGVWILNPETKSSKWDNTLLAIYELKQGSYKDDIVPLETYLEMVHSEDVEKVKSEFQKAIQTGASMDFMFRMVTAITKTPKFIRTKGKVYLDDSGNVLSIYGTNWDITKEMEIAEEREKTLNELRETQSQLIQSEKMASLGVLTAGVAHELNNPLNYIIGGYSSIQQDLDKTERINREEIKEYLNWIKTGADKATDIVKSLNLFSRNNEEKNEVCDLNEIIKSCLLMLQNKYKGRINISTKYEVDEALVTGNSGRLHQAVLNLLSNAIDAISGNGEIEIVTSVKKKMVKLQVIDNGCGISSKNLKKVMDPFFTTKPPGKGTGLGLSITHSVIQEHNGNFTLHSKEGKGTTAVVDLPKAIKE